MANVALIKIRFGLEDGSVIEVLPGDPITALEDEPEVTQPIMDDLVAKGFIGTVTPTRTIFTSDEFINAGVPVVVAGSTDLVAAKAAETLLVEADYVTYTSVASALALPEASVTEMQDKADAIDAAVAALVLVTEATAYDLAEGAVIDAEASGLQADVDIADGLMGDVSAGAPKTALQARIDVVQNAIDLFTAATDELDIAKAIEAALDSADFVSYAAVTAALALPEVTLQNIIDKEIAINDAIAALVGV